VAAVCIAVFVFRAPNVWEFQPSWQLDTVSDIKYQTGKNRLPLPIITDLDSDGINELVIATEDSRLKVLMLPPQEDHELPSTLPHLHLKTEVMLESNSSKPALPVALGAGCERRSTSSLDVCHQILVVVTDDGVVHCFTDQLELMWKANIFTDHKLSDLGYFKEIAVLVVPDSGLVLIGGKMANEQQQQDHLEHNHRHNLSTGLTAEEVAKLPPRRHRSVKTVTEEKEHFSTYAFDSKTGAARWKHEPGDYETDRISREDLVSAYHFKLALHSSQYHVGEVHWSQYSDSLIASLPYRWQHPADTELQTAHFVKKHPAPPSKTPRKDFKTSDGPHLKREKPNAVVIKREKSIEVLSLDSGQPLCSYPVSKDVTSVGDVNGDNVIDHVTTYFTSESVVQSEISPCSAVVTSGAKTLFSGSICRATSTLGNFFDSIDEADFRDEPMPVSPLLVPSPPDRTGIFSHLSGKTFKRQSIRSFDSVFVVASGLLTSFGPYGEFNWQVDTGASWANYKPSERKPGAVFVPNIQAVSTSVGGIKDAVLVTGLKDISLVSLKDGSLLSSHSIPCEPLSPIVHGDFTNDGLMDFVVHCKTR